LKIAIFVSICVYSLSLRVQFSTIFIFDLTILLSARNRYTKLSNRTSRLSFCKANFLVCMSCRLLSFISHLKYLLDFLKDVHFQAFFIRYLYVSVYKSSTVVFKNFVSKMKILISNKDFLCGTSWCSGRLIESPRQR
jgi:hypothetical protein